MKSKFMLRFMCFLGIFLFLGYSFLTRNVAYGKDWQEPIAGWYIPDAKDHPYVPPHAGENEFEERQQKVIKSYGYGAENVDEIKDLLPLPFYNMVKDPDFWGPIRINVTPYKKYWTDDKSHPLYAHQEATKKHGGQARIAENGDLVNWTAGTPFPEPKNGLEVIFNANKRFRGDDRWQSAIMHVTNKKGQHKERISSALFLFFKGRLILDPKPDLPNPYGIEFIHSFGYTDPYDMRGVIPMYRRYVSQSKDDDMWMYLPTIRRVRRMSTAQRHDPLAGDVDWTWDDWEGFGGKSGYYSWTLVERKEMLMPRMVGMKCSWNRTMRCMGPDSFYQKMNVYIIDGVPGPKFPNAIYSKIRNYVDPETWAMLYSECYDMKGRLWKFSKWDNGHDRGWYPNPTNMTGIDIQRNHATTCGSNKHWMNRGLKPSDMDMDALKRFYGVSR